MKKLTQYLNLRQEIYDYFDYTEGSLVFSLEDLTEYSWAITDDVDYVEFYLPGDDEEYGALIVGKQVFSAKHFTMICVNWGDGNIFLGIFDNKKCVEAKSQPPA